MNFIKYLMLLLMARDRDKTIGLSLKNSTEGTCILVKRDNDDRLDMLKNHLLKVKVLLDY